MTDPNAAPRLLPSLKAEAERLARAEGTTLDQLVNAAVAEKIAAMSAPEYFRDRARGAAREAFDRVLDAAPDVEPEDWDRIEGGPPAG